MPVSGGGQHPMTVNSPAQHCGEQHGMELAFAGAGAYISIDRGAALKLTARLQHYDADRPLFTGAGV